MAVELSLAQFERIGQMINRKKLARSYYTIPGKASEFGIPALPLGCTGKLVLEVTIDKEYVKKLQTALKKKGYEIIGAENYYYLGCLLSDYEKTKNLHKNYAEQMEAIRKDYEQMKKCKAFKEIENDDCVFYFLPYNEKVETLSDFVEVEKDYFLKFAKKDDLTVFMKVTGYTEMIDGFMGFNFVDADENGNGKEENIDFSCAVYVKPGVIDPVGFYVAAQYLTAVSKNPEDLEMMNCHILAEERKDK